MNWYITTKGDYRARLLADQHYSRQSPGNPQWTAPGRNLVLIIPNATHDQALAIFVLNWSKFPRRVGGSCWYNSHFRNTTLIRSSELILEALAVARHEWGSAPPDGVLTFVDPQSVAGVKVHGKLIKGFSYRKAGFVVHPELTVERDLLRFSLSATVTNAITPQPAHREAIPPRHYRQNMQLSMLTGTQ